jgi:hypothetical protein
MATIEATKTAVAAHATLVKPILTTTRPDRLSLTGLRAVAVSCPWP